MTRSLDLSIIIVNWNSAEFVRACIGSIQAQMSGLTYEIIVVDNGSFDGCDKMLRDDHLDAVYVQNETNIGFAKANNLALEVASGKSLLFLNPDTKIVGSAIVDLYGALQQLPTAGAVGAKLLNADGTVQTSCIQSFPTIINQMADLEFLRRIWPQWELWGMKPLFSGDAHASEVEVISGACLMVRREAFEQVGRFSEEYFMYGEDADLCLKLAQAGMKNYYVPGATVVHFGGGSSRNETSDFSAMMMRESIWRFFYKTRGRVYAFAYRGCILLSACCRIAFLAPVLLLQKLRRRQQCWTGAIRKWKAILRWSIRRENWLRRSSAL